MYYHPISISESDPPYSLDYSKKLRFQSLGCWRPSIPSLRHMDFQSNALPTRNLKRGTKNRDKRTENGSLQRNRRILSSSVSREKKEKRKKERHVDKSIKDCSNHYTGQTSNPFLFTSLTNREVISLISANRSYSSFLIVLVYCSALSMTFRISLKSLLKVLLLTFSIA